MNPDMNPDMNHDMNHDLGFDLGFDLDFGRNLRGERRFLPCRLLSVRLFCRRESLRF